MGENPNVRRAVEEIRRDRIDHERRCGKQSNPREVERWSREIGERHDRKRDEKR